MSNDTSFIDLTKPKNLSKIKIQPVVIPIFINTMYRMQEYFNKHNYTKHFNYKELFKEFILTSDVNKQLVIHADFTLDKTDSNGFYFKDKNEISLNGSLLHLKAIEFTLCHEFIHFITEQVFTRKMFKNSKDMKLHNNGFIQEALTEMLSMEIYPEYSKISGYISLVKMMEFVNELSGSINHYQSFLLGYINIKVVDWWKKTQTIKKYEEDFLNSISGYYAERNSYLLKDAISSYNYINAQRNISLAFFENINTFDEYFSCLGRIANSPVLDTEFYDNLFLKKEIYLIEKLNIFNGEYKGTLLNSLVNFRNNILRYHKKNIELLYHGGTLYLYENLNYANYGNGIVENVEKYFADGIYTYKYFVDGIEYIKTVNKTDEYNNLMYARDLFEVNLKYILDNNKNVHNSR